MATLNVGPGQTYATLATAVAASHDGDVIEVQAGTYTDDFATVATKVTIKGTGGMADFVAATPPSNGKGILVTQSDVTIQNLSFAGAKVTDLNGAGIRYEGGTLVVEDSYFHDNQNGILANADADGEIYILRSEFKHNGAGDGYSHNIYVNKVASLTIEDSFFHDAVVGHQIKSRAESTTISKSRIYDDSGNGSYSIDLPNGGVGSINDCVIQQSAGSQNSVIIHYGGEGTPYPGSSLDIADCTVVNDKTTGSVFLLSNATTITANLLDANVWGLTAAQIASGPVHENGTAFLASRPKLDSSSPWDDEGTVDPNPEPNPEPEPEPLPEGILVYPDFKKANDPGDVGRFNIQVEAAQAARHVSWGQIFAKGKVPGTAVLRSTIGDNPAQMDVKTTYDDATVCHAVMTARAPKFDAAGIKKGKLILTTGTPNPDLDFAAALEKYDVTVELSGGLQATLDLKAELLAVLGDYWLQGPLATQARVDIPILNSLRLVADVTAYHDGTFLTDLQFCNDAAMDNTSSKVSYTATIEDGTTNVYQSPPLTHHLYEEWRFVFHSSNGLPTSDTHNIQHNVADLIAAGALLNYDTTSGIDSDSIRAVATTNIVPFSKEDFLEYMPTTGHRDDLGIMPGWCARWLKSQDITAARQCLANANGAGSIPWHYWDAAKGAPLSLTDYPTLWNDGRGNPPLSPTSEDIPPNGRWTLDIAHTPDPSFIPYLLTGERYHLDCLNDQATAVEFQMWPDPRLWEQGLCLNDSDEIRAQGWMFRTVHEAWWCNPDGSPLKEYWAKIVDNNYANMFDVIIPKYDEKAGEVAGYMGGGGGRSEKPPALCFGCFTQEYFISVMGAAAARGDDRALEVLRWMENWGVGRWLHQAEGLGWAAAVGYLFYYTKNETEFLDTWAEMGAMNDHSDTLPTDGSNFVALGLESLAIFYNACGNADALRVYNEVKAQNVPGTETKDYQSRYPQFHIVPKEK